MPLRNAEPDFDPRERFVLYRLCDCSVCEGTGKDFSDFPPDAHEQFRTGKNARPKCPECRGEGRVRELLATCESPEAVGVALVTLGREGEWEECPFGLLDREGEASNDHPQVTAKDVIENTIGAQAILNADEEEISGQRKRLDTLWQEMKSGSPAATAS